MELNILEKKDNKLLSRVEVVAEMAHEGPTPGYNTMKKALAKQLNSDESLIAIKHIYPSFGKPKIKVIANIYENKKAMEEIEPAPAEKKEKKPAAAEKKEEKKPEKPAEEKPAEEKPKEKPKGES